MSQLIESQHLKIPLKEIEIATKNFENCIGKGGYGFVYKGELLISGSHTPVAVKRLYAQFGQGLKEFLTEIYLLCGQNHPNLISLVGFCEERNDKMIIYEYAERGSLDKYLRRSNKTDALTWLQRLQICIHVARGLNHLHNGVGKHQTIIHRDIKSSNILITQEWVAKISDLGLSKLAFAGLNRSAVISHACGTPGYCEPEYIISGIVKKESDIYSLGMVLFEVFCGRLCTIRDDDGFLLSAPLVKDHYQKQTLHQIVDPSLKEQMSVDSMEIFSAIAYGCLQNDRKKRPPIDLVAKKLEGLLRSSAGACLLLGGGIKYYDQYDLKSGYKLVRCPQCLAVLRAQQEFVVFQCGGCGSKLQFSKKRSDALSATLSSNVNRYASFFPNTKQRTKKNTPIAIDVPISLLLSFSVLLNSIYPVLSGPGVAVGAGMQAAVAVVNLICFYVIGVPLVALLGYLTSLEIKGIWIGMICGVLTQTIYMTWRTDWDDHVKKASARLAQFYVNTNEKHQQISSES